MAYDAIVVVALIDESALRRAFETAEQVSGVTINFQGYEKKIRQGKTNSQLETEKFQYLLTRDKIALSNYYSKILNCNMFTSVVKIEMMDVKYRASRLIGFLKNEYQLESDY